MLSLISVALGFQCEGVTMGRTSLGEQSAFPDLAWKNSPGLIRPRPQVTLSLEFNNRLRL